MVRLLMIFFLVIAGTIVIDQNIKMLFVHGFYWDSSCVSLELYYNKGVAFSMFAFLGPYLKWIQIGLVAGIVAYIFYEKYLERYAFPLGLLVGAAISNLYDRFLHGGVVDYIAWHCGFDFAIFNYADVMINIAVAWILIAYYFAPKEES